MIDLYLLAIFVLGALAGTLGGFWLSGLITNHKVTRLGQKINALSDEKFKLKGQRVCLKQLEQRLDAEAATIPLTEKELKDKSGEVHALTAALKETTALTSELAEALRGRKIKVQRLQVELSKWIKRNQALRIKTEQTAAAVNDMQDKITLERTINEKHDVQTAQGGEENEPATTAAEALIGKAQAAAPAIAAGQHLPAGSQNGSVDRLTSRVQEMESELQSWFDRLGKLEANVTGQQKQASGLALLEEVLRSEADKQSAAASDDTPQLLGGRSAS